jgi:hypothetical protein
MLEEVPLTKHASEPPVLYDSELRIATLLSFLSSDVRSEDSTSPLRGMATLPHALIGLALMCQIGSVDEINSRTSPCLPYHGPAASRCFVCLAEERYGTKQEPDAQREATGGEIVLASQRMVRSVIGHANLRIDGNLSSTNPLPCSGLATLQVSFVPVQPFN